MVSFNKLQNRSTLKSSKGASTSSKIHIGVCLLTKVENINAKEARAFSPPDKSESLCNFLPGGDTKILILLLMDHLSLSVPNVLFHHQKVF